MEGILFILQGTCGVYGDHVFVCLLFAVEIAIGIVIIVIVIRVIG